MSVVEPAKQAENKPLEERAQRAFVVGLNAWFCSTGYPWLFLDAPDPVLTALHVMPLLVLVTGVVALAWRRGPGFLRENASTMLLASFPVSVVGAVIARERASQTLALSGFAQLWCVLSLWVFVGVLTYESPPALHREHNPARARSARRTWWLTAIVIGGALLITFLGPTWSLPMRASQPWSDAEVSGALLTAAIGVALGLGVLMIVLGPAAIKARKPTGTPWPRRVVPSLVLAALTWGTYLLVDR